jgi:hypothetical protein
MARLTPSARNMQALWPLVHGRIAACTIADMSIRQSALSSAYRKHHLRQWLVDDKDQMREGNLHPLVVLGRTNSYCGSSATTPVVRMQRKHIGIACQGSQDRARNARNCDPRAFPDKRAHSGTELLNCTRPLRHRTRYAPGALAAQTPQACMHFLAFRSMASQSLRIFHMIIALLCSQSFSKPEGAEAGCEHHEPTWVVERPKEWLYTLASLSFFAQTFGKTPEVPRHDQYTFTLGIS